MSTTKIPRRATRLSQAKLDKMVRIAEARQAARRAAAADPAAVADQRAAAAERDAAAKAKAAELADWIIMAA